MSSSSIAGFILGASYLTMSSFFDLVPLSLIFLKYQMNDSNAEDTMKVQRGTVAKSTRLNGCLSK